MVLKIVIVHFLSSEDVQDQDAGSDGIGPIRKTKHALIHTGKPHEKHRQHR